MTDRMEYQQKRLLTLFILLAIVEGCAALAALVYVPSDPNQVILFGLSKSRLLVVLVVSILVWFLAGLLVRVLRTAQDQIFAQTRTVISNKSILLVSLTIGFALFIICVGFWLLFFTNIREYTSLIHSLAQRYGGVTLWLGALGLQTWLFFLISARRHKILFSILQNSVFLSWLSLILCLILWLFFNYYDQQDWTRQLHGQGIVFLLPSLIALFGSVFIHRTPDPDKKAMAKRFFVALIMAAVVFSLIRLTGYLAYRLTTPPKSYWDLLAEAFLQGRTWLENPPTNHDLTLFNGEWYVPNPPLPALLLVPFVWLFGQGSINMTVFSALLASLNAMIVFLILESACDKGMIQTSFKTNVWVTLLFAFGTSNYWLATLGQMWFVSQLSTTLFCALACLMIIRYQSGWLGGICFGLAMLARPNVFPGGLFLLGIALWKNSPAKIRLPKLQPVCVWIIQFAIPAAACVVWLLYYNKIRFGSWLDFGYVTIHGAPAIVEAVQKYGMFHPHFFRTNLDIMLFRLPKIDLSGQQFFFQPGISGYSIFAMTPALIFAFRRWHRNWWIVGAVLSVLLTLVLLLLYHNTGAEQVGYRYLMDAIIPILLLIANGVEKKPGLLFKLLTILGVGINFVSIYWWYLIRA